MPLCESKHLLWNYAAMLSNTADEPRSDKGGGGGTTGYTGD